MSQITDQIRERVDIVDLIHEYVPELKKMGINWKSRCPFHQEKTPSFVVNPDKGIWHCFGCGKGGDVFGFIKEVEGIEFADALRLLAKRAGVTLEKQDPRVESQRTRELDMLRLSAVWYHQALLTAKSGEFVRNYLHERTIGDEARDAWQLGFAPDAWDGLLTYLQSRGYREQEIATAGLAAPNDRGSHYDRFRNRLMFPISDVHGTIVGFTGRKLNEEDVGGKYINTPETAVYHKSNILYGLSRAKQAIRQEDLVVVVEGNMDCLSSHQAGITNVVAASGTALTPEQIRLIKRFAKNICLAFDPDTAGQDALMRGLSVAWQEDLSIRVVELPEGADPDDLIREDPEQWRARIREAQPFMDWLIARAEKTHDLLSAEGKKRAGAMVLPWIVRLPNLIEQTHYFQIFAAKLSVDENTLRSEASKHRQGAAPSSPGSAENAAAKPRRNFLYEAAVRFVALALRAEDTKAALDDFSHDWLPSEELVTLYKSLDFFYDSRVALNRTAWLEQLSEAMQPLGREVVLVADELDESTTPDEAREEAGQLRERLRTHYIKQQLFAVRKKIKSSETLGNADELQKHITEWQRLNNELRP